MKDAQACDDELLRKLDSAASPEVSGMLNRYFVAALCESAAARLRFKDAAIDNLAAEVQRLREWEAFAAHEIATLKSSLQRLREGRRWRSTKTEPPSDEQWQVLIYDGRNVDIGSKLDGIGWTHEFGLLEWEAVTHWMPLPAPPDAG